MNTEPSATVTSESYPWPRAVRFLPSLCWSAIIGGTVTAIGIHILLTALGMGAGLATFTPVSDTNPVASFSMGAAMIWSICALAALACGGFVAGRFSHSPHGGFAHGVLVWCSTLIITLLLASVGTGMVMGGALKVLGQGIGMGGKAMASGVGEAAKAGLKRSGDQVTSFIDEAVQSGSTNATPQATTHARREIGFALTKLFTPGNETNAPVNRIAAISALTQNAGMSEADATKAVDGFMASAKNLKTELEELKARAEAKAREAADRAADNLSCAALWSFFGLLIGLVVTSLSGRCGATCALRHMSSDEASERETTRVALK